MWAQDITDVYQQLQKLKNGTKVLYLAAHPDDENTRIISYLSNHLNLELAYLSLTRGDGGQNLIGTEKGPGLGLIRTQELLAARNTDKAQQFFTRANDFGYSKNAKETLQKWEEDSILNDMVWVIRNYQPDVIINRFPPDKRAGHGHHTTSALLSEKAIELAQDPKAFPHQLKYCEPHTVPFLFFNTSTWWGINLDSLYQTNPENYLRFDIGTYNPNLGVSYNEIAAQSRSMHRSQGFGMALQRGSQIEYLERIKGDPKQMTPALFKSHAPKYIPAPLWKSYQKHINTALNQLQFNEIQQITPALLEAYKVVQEWPSSSLKREKIKYLKNLLLEVNGIYFEFNTEKAVYLAQDSITYQAYVIQRNPNIPIKVQAITVQEDQQLINETLNYNEKWYTNGYTFAPQFETQQAYWLRAPYDAMYQIPSPLDIGKPQNSPLIPVNITLQLNETSINFTAPMNYKWVDPAYGEKSEDIQIQQELNIKLKEQILFLDQNGDYQVEINVTANKDFERKALSWMDDQQKEHAHFFIPAMKKGEQKNLTVKITKEHLNPELSQLTLYESHGHSIPLVTTINYEHIPKMYLHEPCRVHLIPHHFETPNNFKIAYLKGSGDYIPNALMNMGYDVTTLDPENLTIEMLSQYATLVIGIRAYNVLKEQLYQHHPLFLSYMDQGGHIVVQYQTSRRLDHSRIWPYEMKLGRGRVTEENAQPNLLQQHTLLSLPHAITSTTFENWVQERGLYFAQDWNQKQYETFISWNDQDESPLEGSLLLAHYGKGSFIYTGISFFRQLPAGVSGAYLLFNNLIQYPLYRERP